MTEQHTTALVIGSTTIGGTVHADYNDIAESCFPCVMDGREPGPCTQRPTTAADLTTGALVQTLPAPRWANVASRSAVVITAMGSGTSTIALVWFWALGPAEYQRTVWTVQADEVVPLQTTLKTLPQQTYRAMVAAHGKAEGPNVGMVAPLTAALAAAHH
ncbi:DUF6409 family protein [Streptomyces chryseus]|uniref:DUF6409 family protein n=1 Tax=Streptomyces chryseus TaxID=68186 RepID=UPI00110FEE26|nr:DUF6409 family protein [Streptomyces chryseus]GGX36380.1 hypothetical protein GCM10010353_59280 [Streptomyces chryseus]